MNTLQQSLQNARDTQEFVRQFDRISAVYTAALRTLRDLANASNDPDEFDRFFVRYMQVAQRYKKYMQRYGAECNKRLTEIRK